MLLRATRIGKAFGPDVILRGASFQLASREKVALVGRNGSGKSTLVKIVTGNLEADEGSFHLARGAKIGYLRQQQMVVAGRTVLEQAESVVEDRVALKRRRSELESLLSRTPTEDDLEEFALLSEHFHSSEAYSVESDVRTVLKRMGFEEHEFDKPTSALSGGERTRLAIAGLLLQQPDLLILDEPTNHLDLQATEWLEGWIRGYHGAVLLVSHDRRFLEATAERVLELSDGAIQTYPGPFGNYLDLRAAETERKAKVAARQAADIAKLDEYVRRFMNSQRTAQARGRLKQMNRLIASQTQAPKNDKGMRAGFGKASRTGDIVVQCQKLQVGFLSPAPVTLFPALDWTVRVGERWGVVGENGAGKSSLAKTILGLQQPVGGASKLGAGVVAGYFSQDAEDLDPGLSPFETLVDEFGMTHGEARNLLGRFLISGDDAFRPIGTLSGGERNKLSLARLTALQPNLLVLDEPTNHLDMDSREALADVLREFNGTLLLISHDRWLLDQVTNQTLDVRRSGAVQFGGSYSEYRMRSAGPTRVAHKAAIVEQETTMSPRELSKEIERGERLVASLENSIHALEEEQRSIETKLSAPQADEVRELSKRHADLAVAIANTVADWESATLRLDSLRAKRAG